MAKQIRNALILALVYFSVIIPVQSQQNSGEVLETSEDLTTSSALKLDTVGAELIEIESESGSNSGLDVSTQSSGVENDDTFSGPTNSPPDIINNLESGFIDDTTGQNEPINQTPDLIISEIYYDGTEEWIEITNLGINFSGNIQLQLPQSIFYPIQISQNQSIILTKLSQTYSWLLPTVAKNNLPASFSFTDTKAIFISLIWSGEIIDTFDAETGLVLKYNDKKTSLIKYYNNQIGLITGETIAINVLSPYIASPGFWNNNQTGDSQITSGSDLGGETLSGIVDIPTPSSPQPLTLSITEIYYANGQLSPFIEIKALQAFSGKIFFSGSLLQNSFFIDTTLEKNEIFLIIQSDNGWLSTQKKQENTSLYLNTSGFLQIYGQSGQVFDIIQILSTQPNKSNYNGAFSNQGIDIFDEIDEFSPGFDENFLVYFDHICYGETGQNSQNSGNSNQTTSGAVSSSGTQNGLDLSGSIASGLELSPKSLQIISLQHKTPESITLKSNIESIINLSSKDRYLLTKENTTSPRKTTKKYLTGFLSSGESTTIFKTRGFLDAGSCVGLFYKITQLDEFCYSSTVPLPIQEPETEIEEEIPSIKILGVLPNPKGKDDQEELHLLLEEPINQSYQIPEKSLFLQINTTKKYLTGVLDNSTGTVIIGSLGLVNKAVCLELRYKTTIIDQFCYREPKEGEFLDKNGPKELDPEIQEEIPVIQIFGILPNPKGKDDQEVLSLLRTKQLITGDEAFLLPPKSLYLLNNTSKIYLSGMLKSNTGTLFVSALGLTNKANCVELRYYKNKLDRFCYPNPKEDEYFGTGNIILQTIQNSDFSILQKVGFIITGSQICVSHQGLFLSCRSLPASKTSIKLKNENKLYKTYFSMFQSYLMKDRSTLYYNTDIKTYFDTFKNAKSQVGKFNSSITISGEKLDVYNLSGQIELKTNTKSEENYQQNISLRKRFLIRFGL